MQLTAASMLQHEVLVCELGAIDGLSTGAVAGGEVATLRAVSSQLGFADVADNSLFCMPMNNQAPAAM